MKSYLWTKGVHPQILESMTDPDRQAKLHHQKKKSSKSLLPHHTLRHLIQHNDIVQRKKGRKKQTADLGIAEGGARTRDLEVVLYLNDKSHTLYRLSYPGKVWWSSSLCELAADWWKWRRWYPIYTSAVMTKASLLNIAFRTCEQKELGQWFWACGLCWKHWIEHPSICDGFLPLWAVKRACRPGPSRWQVLMLCLAPWPQTQAYIHTYRCWSNILKTHFLTIFGPWSWAGICWTWIYVRMWQNEYFILEARMSSSSLATLPHISKRASTHIKLTSSSRT